MFEWQKHSHESTTVPHYRKLLDFINLHAQASESLSPSKEPNPPNKPIAADASDTSPNCITDRHPLYASSRFKSLSNDQKINSEIKWYLRDQGILWNNASHCIIVKNLTTPIDNTPTFSSSTPAPPKPCLNAPVVSNNLSRNPLMMTCMVLVEVPDSSTVKDRLSIICLVCVRVPS